MNDQRTIKPRTMIYALGGGLGHLTRGLALARQLLPSISEECLLLTNSPFAAAVTSEVKRYPGLSLHRFAPEATAKEVAIGIRRLIDDWLPQLLIVDTFPRGVGGELADILPECGSLPKVLIGRNLPEEYVAAYDIRPFVAAHYQLVIVPGEKSCWNRWPDARQVNPIVLRTVAEQFPVAEARERLQLSSFEPCVLAVGTGSPREIEDLHDLVAALAADWPSVWPPLRFAVPPGPASTAASKISLPLLVAHYPVSELFSAVRLVIGNAGYNLIHEAQQASVPMFALVRERQYDDQRQRATAAIGVTAFSTVTELRERLATALTDSPSRQVSQPTEPNGAIAAAELIQSLWAPLSPLK